VPLVEPCCPAQSVCHITVSRLMSERILNIIAQRYVNNVGAFNRSKGKGLHKHPSQRCV